VIGAAASTAAVRRRLSANIATDRTGRPGQMDRQTGAPWQAVPLRAGPW